MMQNTQPDLPTSQTEGPDVRINFRLAFADLLKFVGQAGLAIRMNSAYHSAAAKDPKVPFDVMWLADMLHELGSLGEAVAAGNLSRIVLDCDRQIGMWERYRTPNTQYTVSPHETFERWEHIVSLDSGLAMLRRLRDSAKAAADSL